MRFAFVIFKYFPYGGMQRDMLRIAQRLAQAGHAVEIFTLDWQGERPSGNIMVQEYPTRGWTNIQRYQRFLDQVQAHIAERHHSAQAFDLLVGFNRATWLHAYFGADPCFKARAYTQRPWLYRLTPRYRWFAHCEQAIFGAHSDTQILLLSEQEKQHFQYWYHTPASRFHFIPPYLPAERLVLQDKNQMRAYLRSQFALQEQDFVFLLVGSGFFMKGLDRAIAGLASLPLDQRARVKLIAIGQDKPAPMLKLAQQFGVSQQLIISAGRNDIPQLMQGADVYLHPAHRENTGLVILEAMACGLPVITTATTGYSRYVEQAQAGVVVPYPFHQQALNDAMLAALQAPSLVHYAQAGRRAAEQLMQQNQGNAEAEVLQQLAQQRRNQAFAQDTFVQIMHKQGEYFRNLPRRKTLRVSEQGQQFFIKQHFAIGWREIIKNLCSGKWPIIGAATEVAAIRKLTELGIATTPLVKFEQSGCWPWSQQSYLITQDLGHIVSLDHWFADSHSQTERDAVIEKMAHIVGQLHAQAIYHQDLYLCHFCLPAQQPVSQAELALIDLHRCRLLSKANYRAAVKDLAALYFSTMDVSFSQSDWQRFVQAYQRQAPAFVQQPEFWQAITQRAQQLHKKFHSHAFQQRLAQERAKLR